MVGTVVAMPERSGRKVDDSADLKKSVQEAWKDPAAVALGRKGGLKGGKARAARLTAEERSESARVAARARWSRGQEG